MEIDTDLTSSIVESEDNTTYINTSDDGARWSPSLDLVQVYRNGVLQGSVEDDQVPAGYQNRNNQTNGTSVAIVYSEPASEPACVGHSYWETYHFDVNSDNQTVDEDPEFTVNTTSWWTKKYDQDPQWTFWEYKLENRVIDNPAMNRGNHSWNFSAPIDKDQPGDVDAFKVQYRILVDDTEVDQETIVIEAQGECK